MDFHIKPSVPNFRRFHAPYMVFIACYLFYIPLDLLFPILSYREESIYLIQTVGWVPPATPEGVIETLTTCGTHVIKSSDINEWYRFPVEWHFPFIMGSRPQFWNQYWEPIGMELRILNMQVTTDNGPNATDHAGLAKNAQLIFYKDNYNLFGPCPEPEEHMKAFTDYVCNERNMHNGYDRNGFLNIPDPIKLPKQNGFIKITETCAEVQYVQCNTYAEYTYEWIADHKNAKRLTLEWKDQIPPDESKKDEITMYSRFDYFGFKKVKPFRQLFNGYYGRRMRSKTQKPYFLPKQIITYTWAEYADAYPNSDQKAQNHNFKRRTFDCSEAIDTFSDKFSYYEMYKGLANAEDVS